MEDREESSMKLNYKFKAMNSLKMTYDYLMWSSNGLRM